MPTYQYACTECQHAFEEFQNFSDDALTVCPQCGGRLRKLFNAVGVVFKGSGFYRTDSRTGAASGGAETTSATTSTPATAGSTSSTGASSTGAASSSPAASSAASSSASSSSTD